MSQRIFYEIDGRVQGPVTFLQLQLLASSGMLQPQHRVRKESDENWFPAKQVKGLFSATEAAATAAPSMPAARPVAVAPQHVAAPMAPQPGADFPSWGDLSPTPGEDSEINPTFDFFSDSDEQVSPAHAQGSRAEDEGIPTLSADDLATGPAPAPTPTTKPPEPKTTVLKSTELAESKHDVPAKAPDAAAPAEPGYPECVGQAAELLDKDAVRLLDGKIAFRLIRGWIQAMSKFSDGSMRTVYVRLGALDAACFELRPTARRTRGGPYPVLSFVAGPVQIAMSIQGSDKPHRAFMEKVLLAAAGKSPNPK